MRSETSSGGVALGYPTSVRRRKKVQLKMTGGIT